MMIERTVFRLSEIKFSGTDPTEMKFSGYGAVFGNMDAYGDVIEPGAFANFLAEAKAGRMPWPSMLSQHGGFGLTADDLTPIGVWDDLVEDGTGLRVEGSLAATQRGRDVHTLMGMKPRAAINGLSIGYITKESIPRSKPEEPRRRLKRIDLIEISPVTFPANGKAVVSSVKMIEDINSLKDAESYLRDAGGLSRTEAKALIARLSGLGQRDADGGMHDVVESLRRSRAFCA
jgi:uncharacterized protein